MSALPALNYQHLAARGASPVGLVVMLHDTAIRSLHAAIRALEEGKIEERVQASNHVLAVLGQLQGTLDYERGGEVARQLDCFYGVARARLLEANVRNDKEAFQQLARLLFSMREAWRQLDTQNASEPPGPGRLPTPPAALSAAGPRASNWKG